MMALAGLYTTRLRKLSAFWLAWGIYMPVLLLVGCSPADQARALWQDYENRLANVLEADLSAPMPNTDNSNTTTASESTQTILSQPRFSQPKRSEWHGGISSQSDSPDSVAKRISPNSIGLLDLAALNHCRLGGLIADHNSSLGKVAQPSNLVIYQLEFIKAAPDCIKTLGDSDLKAVLSAELAFKKQTAARLFVWFLENEPVIRKRLFIGSASLGASSAKAGLIEAETAFNRLLKIQTLIADGDFAAFNGEELNHALNSLNQNEFGVRYMAGMKMNIQALQQLNSVLTNHPLMRCKPGHNPAKQQILLNVLNKFFIGKLQPYLGVYSEAQFRLEPTVTALFRSTAWQPQIDYYFGEDGAPLQLKTLIRRHIGIWQTLQQSCALEIKPGSAGRRPGLSQ